MSAARRSRSSKTWAPCTTGAARQVRFKPDVKIFGPDAHFKPSRLYRSARSKAYLFRGVEIRWSCAPELIHGNDTTPAEETLHFPGGLSDYLESMIGKATTVTPRPFAGRIESKENKGIVEWAVTWSPMLDPFMNSYCNTIPTPQGGTHDDGLALGDGEVAARLRRTHEQPQGAADHGRRRDGASASDAVRSSFASRSSKARRRTSCRARRRSVWSKA